MRSRSSAAAPTPVVTPNACASGSATKPTVSPGTASATESERPDR